MKSEQEPTDQQLDELLQDVAVPQDLKALLKQIPLQAQEEGGQVVSGLTSQQNQRAKPTQRNMANPKTWVGLILAASVIGFGLFVASQKFSNPDVGKPSIANRDNKTTDPENSLAATENKKPAAQLELEIEDRELQILEAQIHAIEIAQLEAQVLQVEQASTYTTDQHEVESIIAAMSEQYSIPLGMPEVKVEIGMAQVIQNFPGTRGAAIAHSYLEQTKNN